MVARPGPGHLQRECAAQVVHLRQDLLRDRAKPRGRARQEQPRRASVSGVGAAEFSTWTPHWIGVVDGPTEIIAIFGPHGERVRLLADALQGDR
jgi:hypothetical protein